MSGLEREDIKIVSPILDEDNKEISETLDKIIGRYEENTNALANTEEIAEEGEVLSLENNKNENSSNPMIPILTTPEKKGILNSDKKSNINSMSKDMKKKYIESIKKYFSNFSQEKEKNSDSNGGEEFAELDNFLGINHLRRLKKKGEVEKEKKLQKKLGMSFFDVEAELGSDNEDHDDVIKKICNEENEEENEEEGEEFLKDLIAEGEENIYEDADTIQEKYFNDMLEYDKEMVKKVIRGPKMLNTKRSRSENYLYEEGDVPLNMRMKKAKSQAEKQDNPEFTLKMLFKNFESVEKNLEEEGNKNNEELNEMYENMQNQLIKKISEQFNNHKKDMISRIKENEKILANVINLNSDKKDKGDSKKNIYFIKGTNNGANTLSHSHSAPLRNTMTSNPFKSVINPRNSFLHAMKNDKYLPKQENLNELTLTNQKSADSISNFPGEKSSKEQVCSVFHGVKKANQVNSNKTTNLSVLFTRSNKHRHSSELSSKPKQGYSNLDSLNLKQILNE